MNTRRTPARRVIDEIENIEATPQGNRNTPQVHAAAMKQVSVNPLPMMDGDVRESLL